MSNPFPRTPIRFLLEALAPFKGLVAASFIFVFFGKIIHTSLPLILKQLVDSLIMTKDQALTIEMTNDVWFWALIYVGTIVVVEFIWRGSGFTGMRWITRTTAHGTKRLFDYLCGHGSEFFSNRFAGSLTGKVGNVTHSGDHLCSGTLWHYFPLLLQIIVVSIILMFTHTILGLIFIGWVIFYLVLNGFLVQKTSRLSINHSKERTALRGQMVDIASNIALVHYYSRRKKEQKHLGAYIDKTQKAELKTWQYSEWVLVINGLLQSLLLGALILGSIYYWNKGLLTLGTVVMVVDLSMHMMGNLFFIGMKMNEFMENYGTMKEGLDEIVQDYDVTNVPQAKKMKVTAGKIDFQNVDFIYPGSEKLKKKNKKSDHIFKRLSLQIPAGQKVGIVGESGAGKSTLTSLLLRLYDIQGGSITIDQQNIASVQQESLRDHIAFVPQDPLLFHRTIKENIRYGRPKASPKEVRQAAKMAHAHEFISTLPEDYETYVGERGVKLSGGQKQRIAIARAMLKRAPILVLDEATSALDSESEAQVQAALSHLMQGKTVLAIAHRLSTLLAMDRIIVLDKGKIIEDGNHKELLAQKGRYAALWEKQAGGFIL